MNNQKAVVMVAGCLLNACLSTVKANPGEGDRTGQTSIHVNVAVQDTSAPRLYLADFLSYLTIRICSQMDQGFSTGTGFFFDFLINDGSGRSIPALITNKHVVDGCTETKLQFTVAKNGLPSSETVEFCFNPTINSWFSHPDASVDLCALPILPIINHFKDQGIELFIMSLNRSHIAKPDFLKNVTQLDDVVMIGYPDGIWDSVNNQPIFRKGVFATKPNVNYNGKREFIIDMPVYGGSSGSPVLIASDSPRFDRSRGNALVVANAPMVVLVGVVYATFLHGEFGRLEAVPIPTLSSQTGIFTHISLPNNLGLVISASRLLEMEDMFTEMLVRANKDTEQKEN